MKDVTTFHRARIAEWGSLRGRVDTLVRERAHARAKRTITARQGTKIEQDRNAIAMHRSIFILANVLPGTFALSYSRGKISRQRVRTIRY